MTNGYSLFAHPLQGCSCGWQITDVIAPTAGVDYLTTMGTLMFGLGTTSRTFSVTLYGDRTLEPDETVVLTLSNPTNGAMIDGSSVASNPASVTILNDDNAPVITASQAFSVSEALGAVGAMDSAEARVMSPFPFWNPGR